MRKYVRNKKERIEKHNQFDEREIILHIAKSGGNPFIREFHLSPSAVYVALCCPEHLLGHLIGREDKQEFRKPKIL